MNRNEFLKNMGFKGAGLLAIYCAGVSLSGCVNNTQSVNPQTQSNLTIDLSDASNKALNTVGGFVVVSQGSNLTLT